MFYPWPSAWPSARYPSSNLALTAGAGVAIAAAGLSTAQSLIVLVIFVILASTTVATPVLANLVLGEKATPMLNSWKAWLIHNNATVMMVLCLVFGFVLLGKGLGALIGS